MQQCGAKVGGQRAGFLVVIGTTSCNGHVPVQTSKYAQKGTGEDTKGPNETGKMAQNSRGMYVGRTWAHTHPNHRLGPGTWKTHGTRRAPASHDRNI